MGFWIRKLIFGVVLAITAYILLDNQELLVSIASNFSSEESNAAAEPSSATGLNVSNFPQAALGTILVPSESVSEGAGFARESWALQDIIVPRKNIKCTHLNIFTILLFYGFD